MGRKETDGRTDSGDRQPIYDRDKSKVPDKVQGHCQAGEEYSGCSGSRNRDSVLCGLFYASPRDGL